MSSKITFKYTNIARTLKDEIRAGQWEAGDRLPGEMLLAQRFSVAHMTVRQAINSLIEERWLLRIPAKGTFVLASPDKPSTIAKPRPMALLFPSDASRLDPYYFPELIDGFQEAVDKRGHPLRLITYESEQSVRSLDHSTVIACLLIDPSHVRVAERLRESRFPVLAINHHTGRRSIPSVYVDDAKGIEEAVDYLFALRHRSIGFLKGPDGNLDGEERLHGFRAATMRHSLINVFEVGEGFREPHGYEAAVKLLTPIHRPTALICASDLAAIGAIRAAHELGLSVPGDLSVIGFGDFSVADYVAPRLTTLRQPRRGLGAAAANALIQLANGGNTAGDILAPQFICRDSTAPASRRGPSGT